MRRNHDFSHSKKSDEDAVVVQLARNARPGGCQFESGLPLSLENNKT